VVFSEHVNYKSKEGKKAAGKISSMGDLPDRIEVSKVLSS